MERKFGSILIEEVMATLEQIIEEARRLSPAEKGKLRQALDYELEQQARMQSAKPGHPSNRQQDDHPVAGHAPDLDPDRHPDSSLVTHWWR